jgi:hypothetical protein
MQTEADFTRTNQRARRRDNEESRKDPAQLAAILSGKSRRASLKENFS